MPAKQLLWLLPLLLLSACANGSGNYAARITDSTATNEPAPPLPQTNLSDSIAGHKMIRTADMQCTVQNVYSATTRLEQLVRSAGGYVQESNMNNESAETKTIYYKPDSLRQVQTYTTKAFMILRVPVPYLDSVVEAIPAMSTFIDSRNLKQNDVTYGYLENSLKNQLVANNNTIAQARKLARKTNDAIATDEYDNGKQEKKITREINNMRLQDSVTYATLTVAFSQPQQAIIQTIVNTDYLKELPFGMQCKIALTNGWDFVRGCTLFIMDIWPIVLLAMGIWVLYRKNVQRKLLLHGKM